MEPYLGELRIFSFGRNPRGWSLCNGAIVNIQQNQTLYSLLGTSFGGDGAKTFALPNLQGRTPIGIGGDTGDKTRSAHSTNGEKGGFETVTLTSDTVPSHTHAVQVTTDGGDLQTPEGAILARPVSQTAGSSTDFSIYLPSNTWSAKAQLAAGTLSVSGGNKGHDNMQPFLVMNYCIATSAAIYPQRP